jgi:hypothetical protein
MDIINQIKLEQSIISESVEWAGSEIDNVLALIDIEEDKVPPNEERIENLQSQLKFWYNRIQLEKRNAAKFEQKYREFILSGKATA